MNVRFLRLLLGLFFLFAGTALLVVRFAAPDAVAKFDPLRIFLGGVFALVLAGWNLMKWYAAVLEFERRSTPVRSPLQREPDAVREEEPNPEFDFSKRDERQPEK
jgi:hypothetical protein